MSRHSSRSQNLLATVVCLFVAWPVTAQPRPLSLAEESAADLALVYLDEGPKAWWDALAKDSPLRELGRDTALLEIELRAGSPEGASWKLATSAARDQAVFTLELASGLEDVLTLTLREEAEGWKLFDLRMSAEPPEGFAPRGSRRDREPAETASTAALAIVPTLVRGGGVVLLVIAGVLLALRRTLPAVAVAAGGAAVLATSFLGAADLPRAQATSVARTSPSVFGDDLESLLALRRAGPQSEVRPRTEPASLVARLWSAQRDLAAHDLVAVDRALKSLRAETHIPLVHLLRARVHRLRRQDIDAALAYQDAFAAGLRHDAILFEAASALFELGFGDRASEIVEELRDLGSRDADIHYTLAQWAFIDDRPVTAARDLETAWDLLPLPRTEILRTPILAYLADDPPLRRRFAFNDLTEPTVDCAGLSQRPLLAPLQTEVVVVGRFLVLRLGERVLEVPGGCELAPAGAELIDAQTWSERREARSLNRLANLDDELRRFGRPGARLLRELVEAANALARKQRWSDLVALTDGLVPNAELERSAEDAVAGLPPELLGLRAVGLHRLDRSAEALRLLFALVRSETANLRSDPTTLYRLAEVLISTGQYDLALRALRKANSELPFQADDRRVVQVQVEKRLMASAMVFKSRHFDVFYPEDQTDYFAETIARTLEIERERQRQWIPVTEAGLRTAVLLLDIGDFKLSYGGLGILGLFDGKMRLPLGSVPRLNDFAYSILGHELTHAMISEATGDRAPHWVHEGLAGHLERVQSRINPIKAYRERSSLLALPLIDPVLESFAAPRQVLVAYDESLWIFHFIEARYGRQAVRDLLAAYAEGATTDEAISRTFGKTVAEFDREIWTWCRTEAPEIWTSKEAGFTVR